MFRNFCTGVAATTSALAFVACANILGFHDVTVGSDDGGATDATGDFGVSDATLDVASADVGESETKYGDATSGENAPDAGGNDASAPTCTGNCVAAAPGGWTGPLEVYFGSTQAACEAPYAMSYTGYDTPSAAATTCTCSCGTPDCTTAPIEWTCGQPCSSVGPATFMNNTCYAPPTMCTASAPFWFAGQSGSCAPSTTPTLPTVSWQNYAIGCRPSIPSNSTCAVTGNVCLPTVPPSSASVCVESSGMVACPAGGSPYSVQHVEFESWTDSRSCPRNCTCGAPAGCSGEIDTYTSSDCTGTYSRGVLNGSTCYASAVQAGMGSYELVLSGTPSSCQPTTATVPPNGDVSGNIASATTFCCLP